MELIFLLFVIIGGFATCGFSVAVIVLRHLQKRQLQAQGNVTSDS